MAQTKARVTAVRSIKKRRRFMAHLMAYGMSWAKAATGWHSHDVRRRQAAKDAPRVDLRVPQCRLPAVRLRRLMNAVRKGRPGAEEALREFRGP